MTAKAHFLRPAQPVLGSISDGNSASCCPWPGAQHSAAPYLSERPSRAASRRQTSCPSPPTGRGGCAALASALGSALGWASTQTPQPHRQLARLWMGKRLYLYLKSTSLNRDEMTGVVGKGWSKQVWSLGGFRAQKTQAELASRKGHPIGHYKMDLYSILRLANVMDIETFLEALVGITTCHWVMRLFFKR